MPRHKTKSFQRNIGVDAEYGSELVQKFINVVMIGGKKNCARAIVYGALDIVSQKTNGNRQEALDLFEGAFQRIVPTVEVRSRRVGGSVYQIPREVRPERAWALGLRWLIAAAKSRSGKTMSIRLAGELLDAHEGRGNAIKKKSDVHRMAEANRAFSHYAW